MGINANQVPRFGAEIVVDGRTYRVSVQIIQGEKAAEAVPIHSHAQFELMAFADKLEQATFATLNDGVMTGDLCGLCEGITPRKVTTEEFIHEIRVHLEKLVG